MSVPLLVVDGANVVGSVPDGWWRDRAGAAIRLRDRLSAITSAGLPDLPGPLEIVLVVEGKARDIPQTPGVRVLRAPGSGDDAIVDLVADQAGPRRAGPRRAGTRQAGPRRAGPRRVVVVTADRELRRRVTALGAEYLGPSSIPR